MFYNVPRQLHYQKLIYCYCFRIKMASVLLFDCVSQTVSEITYDRKNVPLSDRGIARAYSLCMDFRDINFASLILKTCPTQMHIDTITYNGKTFVVISNKENYKYGLQIEKSKTYSMLVLVFSYENHMRALPIYPIDICRIINNILVTKQPCYPCMKLTKIRENHITYSWL